MGKPRHGERAGDGPRPEQLLSCTVFPIVGEIVRCIVQTRAR